jgi:hypothetical protein
MPCPHLVLKHSFAASDTSCVNPAQENGKENNGLAKKSEVLMAELTPDKIDALERVGLPIIARPLCPHDFCPTPKDCLQECAKRSPNGGPDND